MNDDRDLYAQLCADHLRRLAPERRPVHEAVAKVLTLENELCCALDDALRLGLAGLSPEPEHVETCEQSFRALRFLLDYTIDTQQGFMPLSVDYLVARGCREWTPGEADFVELLDDAEPAAKDDTAADEPIVWSPLLLVS